ncbi:hypothetical protein DS838_001974 [Geotrichum bryndzae]|nr:hypothetical protein DV454_002678 [Geotrichum candidum]KAI9213170.1 hypothetical protein DS838_001974 [Geotrichum bryndzae]
MKLRPTLPSRPKLSHEETDRLSTGNISDFDIYNELPMPANTVEVVLHNGFRLTSGVRVITDDPVNKPLALMLLGTEAFEIDLSEPGAVTGLDRGFVSISEKILGVLEVVHPKPELLVVGLGKKSRLLTPDTRKIITSLGIQIELSTTTRNTKACYDVVESDLEKEFSRYGPIERIRVVREKDSDKSRGYAFIEFERERDLKVIKGRKILVDVERGRTVKSWKPAKLGGGLGGRHYTKPKPLLRSQRSDGYSGSSERGGSFRGSSSGGRGGFRGGASRRGGSDRYSSSNSGGVSRQFDGGDRRSSDYGSSGPRKDNYRDRRDFKSGPDDRRDKGRRDYRDRSPGRRY